MLETICSLIPEDPDLPPRARALDILGRVLDGTIYDVLPYDFHFERTGAGEYIPLRNRRPSVRYGLSRVVVEDSVALLFSEGHFPTIDSPDPTVRESLARIVKANRLNELMTRAAICGSVGSVAILLRVLSGRLYFEVLESKYLNPIWCPDAPDQLARVEERYKVSGRELLQTGYTEVDPDLTYWFQRSWDMQAETWFSPLPITAAPSEAEIDLDRTVIHSLGFVPITWVRNLPGPSATGDKNDGACTFRAAVETQIEIDYQLSQAGRGLKYSSDPTLLIKEPTMSDSEIIKSADNALVVSEKGDAKLLEIGGTASSAVLDYVRTLRELALESIHGNRSSADRLTAAQSGRALELMNQGLIWLADNLRISYGEGALLSIATMIMRLTERFSLTVGGEPLPRLNKSTPVSLKWPRWVPMTAADRRLDSETLVSLVGAGLLSRETAIKALAAEYDLEDVGGELERIAVLEPQDSDAGGV